MIEMDPSTLPTAKRRSERNAFSRFLNGAGGDRKIYIVAISFGVLLCVIFVLSSGSSKSHGSMGGSINFKTPENHRQVQVRPTNVSLVIVGDSIARYSYLSLVYFLRWGRWFDPGLDRSNLVNEQSFDNPFHEETFHEFYYQTNLMLQPFEVRRAGIMYMKTF